MVTEDHVHVQQLGSKRRSNKEDPKICMPIRNDRMLGGFSLEGRKVGEESLDF
jgi:hypothetical protein